MARIVLGSYMVRYPLGGMMSWVLQYLIGFRDLGHEVYFVEKTGYANACYDPAADAMGEDCAAGVRATADLLARFGLGDRWSFVDGAGRYHGLGRQAIEDVLRTADLFVDMGTHGAWLPEAAEAGMRVLVDGEPGFTQMKMEARLAAGETLPHYDAYYTTGRSIPAGTSLAPSAGRAWRPIFHPVAVDAFAVTPAAPDRPFTSVMNWQSYEPVEYRGTVYGHKDVEFERFVNLPSLTSAPLELAVSGKNVPGERLRSAGWRLLDAHRVTISFDAFVDYIRASRGEFGVCKSGFVRTRSGWFSDRSAAYLASGRPVVLQDTGFGAHLPTGRGLFAVAGPEDAAAALDAIRSDYPRHARWAREVAAEHLDARAVLRRFLREVGLG